MTIPAMRSQFGCLLMGVIHSIRGIQVVAALENPARGIPGGAVPVTSTWVSTPDIVALRAESGKIQAPQTGPALSIFIKDSRPCGTIPPPLDRVSTPPA